ncbi:MAG: FixH family protein [Erythrobacter sp.]|nr:MAG: FixH family protein [Erythrobacter sp.]
MPRRFTGFHMAAILVTFFGTVMAVNFTMAWRATDTFGGVVVRNTYVASQEFNGWLEAAEAQQALGWKAQALWREDGRVQVQVSGPDESASLVGAARHPLGRETPQQLQFDRQADGSFLSREMLASGRWLLRLELRDGADVWRSEEAL